ncbi:phytoene desaturase family protein [Leucobacter chromiireducens]|uniref:Phytoene desaturase n=1 Tax=Leucobacter chromiireducens subsp. solipictus TaxID=398235 RepID=A0ABS1SJC1_9MICO|nr:phytoene desaturase family protein [Leucobacter chromiireducens]MBL3680653.1 phytoene desaturase [Leucobacter chromiireducens subsp. solipictus]
MTRTLVIGGGVAGLATAALLAREGHDVRLLERGARWGGRAGTQARDGFRFDTGPSWYLMPRVFDHFFDLLGTTTAEQLDLRLLDPGYRVFSEPGPGAPAGRPFDVPYGPERVAAAFERLERGGARSVQRYVASAEHATELAERFFLYNPFTRLRSLGAWPVLREFPRLAPLLAGSLERFVARRFRHPVLRQVLGYPAVFLGTDPSRAPAMYHLMSALDLGDGVRYPMGGFGELVDRLGALAIDAGAEIVTGAEVTEILTRREGGALVANGVRWRDAEGRTHIEHAHTVVSAADLHHTETQLLPPEAQTYPEAWWHRRQSGPGAVIALLGVRGALPELAHHSLFFTRDWDANFAAIFGPQRAIPDPASIYVCRPSATDPGVAPPGHENLFVLIPVPADPELGGGGPDGAGDAAIERAVDAAVAQIASWAGIPDLAERVVLRETIGPEDFVSDYHSWSGGMLGPSHVLRQSAMFRAQNQSRKVRGLYYAGATTAPGVGVPMCLISAELVLKRIRGDHSPGPLPVRVPTAAEPRR